MTYSLKINFSSGPGLRSRRVGLGSSARIEGVFYRAGAGGGERIGYAREQEQQEQRRERTSEMSKATPPQIVSALLRDFYGSYERAIAYCEKITKHSGPLSGDYLAAKDLLLSKQGAPDGRSK